MVHGTVIGIWETLEEGTVCEKPLPNIYIPNIYNVMLIFDLLFYGTRTMTRHILLSHDVGMDSFFI